MSILLYILGEEKSLITKVKRFFILFSLFKSVMKDSVKSSTDRTLLLQSLQAARAVVPHAAAWLSLLRSLLLHQFVDLFVLTHARRELGPQVDQRLLQDGPRTDWKNSWSKLKYFNDFISKFSTFSYIYLNMYEDSGKLLKKTEVCELKKENTHWARTQPEVLLLHKLNVLINSFVPQNLGHSDKSL